MEGSPSDAGILVFVWVLLGLVAVVPIFLLLRGWAEGSIDGILAIGLSCSILLLMALIRVTQGTFWMAAFIVLLLAACLGLPFYFARSAKQELQQMEDDDIAKYQAALERDPRNAGAHALLAEKYLTMGRPDAAVSHYEAALAISPDPERNPHLEKWQRRHRNAVEERAQWQAKHAAKLKN